MFVVICLLISFIYGNESLCIRDVPILDFLLQIAKPLLMSLGVLQRLFQLTFIIYLWV